MKNLPPLSIPSVRLNKDLHTKQFKLQEKKQTNIKM